MDTPDRKTRAGGLRAALRRLVLGAFICAATVIALLVGLAVLSATGLSSDPHGYTVIFGILCAVILTPAALALWLLHQSMQRRSNGQATQPPPMRHRKVGGESPVSEPADAGRGILASLGRALRKGGR